jgi:hypothetical protein
MLDGRMLYFTSAIIFWQLLEVLLNEINIRKDKGKGRKRLRDDDTKEIISS